MPVPGPPQCSKTQTGFLLLFRVGRPADHPFQSRAPRRAGRLCGLRTRDHHLVQLLEKGKQGGPRRHHGAAATAPATGQGTDKETGSTRNGPVPHASRCGRSWRARDRSAISRCCARGGAGRGGRRAHKSETAGNVAGGQIICPPPSRETRCGGTQGAGRND